MMIQNTRWVLTVVFLAVAAVFAGIFFFVSGGDKKESVTNEALDTQRTSRLVIGVGSMITPKEGRDYYEKLGQILSDATGKQLELVFKKSYQEMNDLIEEKEVDIAFICAQPYVEGKKKFGLELLAAPVVGGKTTYNSYIIVNKDSGIENLDQLRGKSFAFTDPISNTGRLIPAYMIAQKGETPETFFSKVTFSGSHDASIFAVANGVVDGAAVDHLIWEYLNKRKPELTGMTKVIAVSSPYGIPPVVSRPGLDPEIKEKIREALLNLQKTEKGREVLSQLDIERFTLIDDSQYDSIREVIDFLKEELK